MLAAHAACLAFDDAALAKQAYAGIILPGYARFDDAARAFAEKSAALCKAPSQAALDATRAAARATLLAWGRIAPIRFGPITYKQRLDRLLFYPDQHGIVGKQTAKLIAKRDDADLDPAKLEGASVAVQGFGAVDVALYGHGAEALATADPEASLPLPLRPRAGAHDIAQIAADTHADWTGEYKQAWLQPGDGNKAFLTAKETTQALFSRLCHRDRGRARCSGWRRRWARSPPRRRAPCLPHSGLGLPYLISVVEGERDLVGDQRLPRRRSRRPPTRSAPRSPSSAASPPTWASPSAPAKPRRRWRRMRLQDAPARERLAPMLLSLKNAEATGRAALGDLTGQTLGFNSLDGD